MRRESEAMEEWRKGGMNHQPPAIKPTPHRVPQSRRKKKSSGAIDGEKKTEDARLSQSTDWNFTTPMK
jgi:hypothetical protein